VKGRDKVHSYRDLLVWGKGIELTKELYAITKRFPDEERFGLTSQIRRACVSIPSNIAEGQARQSTKEFIKFLYITRGSLAELDTQLFLAREFGYIATDEYDTVLKKIDEIQRMSHRLIESLIRNDR
jgi:four helix bundle protein